MIRQYDAQQLGDSLLRTNNLWNLGWRISFSKSEKLLGYCAHSDRRIVLSIHHLNSTSDVELRDTLLHEIAHALTGPGKGHNQEWIDKAKEIGLADPKPCGRMNVDAGRSLQEVEVKEKKKIKAIQELCPKCNKVAVEIARLGNETTGYFLKLECGHLIKKENIVKTGKDYTNWTSETGKVIFPYQIEGIRFLERANGRALIADEPGLGKTIQAAGFCHFHEEETAPVLWVCKATLKLQAVKEFLDWCGLKWTPYIIESARSVILPGFKVYVVSMDLLRRLPTEKLEKIGFKTVVADEIQHFKNPDSTRTGELRKIVAQADFFIPLSGTPWKNRGAEYFPVLNMLDPKKFPSEKHFKNYWVDYYIDERGKTRMGGIRDIPRFREHTKDFIIRRMRDEVLPDLPKINRQIRYVEMEEMYKDSYDEAEDRVATIIKAAFIDDKPVASIMGELMALKHITGLAKVSVCIDDVKEFIEDTEELEKITIFHHHIDVGDYLQKGDGLTYKGLDEFLVSQGLNKTLRLYGGRSADERNRVIEQFKNDPKSRVLIASTLASGEGLNIQFCQNAIMLERQWNPANEEQAELRFSRPITKNDLPPYLHVLADRKVSIRVPYFTAEGTIDSMLTEMVERKRLAFRKTMNKGEENLQWNEMELMKELAQMIMNKRLKKR